MCLNRFLGVITRTLCLALQNRECASIKFYFVKPYLAAGDGGTVVGALLPVRDLLGVQRVVAGADVGGLIDNTGGCSGGGGGGGGGGGCG